MKRIATAFAAAALLAACAGEKEPVAEFKSVGAPTLPDVATHITADDNGKTVEVRAGTKIQVDLIGVPTAGYMWSVVAAPAFLEAAGDTGGPTSEAQSQPGFAGGSHWEVFFFDVMGEGSGELRLEQRGVMETEGPAADTFSVTVNSTLPQ